MDSFSRNSRESYQQAILWSIGFLFFFQLLTEFVEGIYLYGLLGTEIPPEIGLVTLLLIPFLLIIPRKSLSPPLVKLLASLGLIARSIEIFLPTRGRMIISGIGLAGLLLFLPAYFSMSRNETEQKDISRQIGMGIVGAIITHILFRALHSGSDLSGYGNYRLISVGLTIISLVILWRSHTSKNASSVGSDQTNKFLVFAYSMGLFGIIVLLYFAIIAPNIVARWAGVSSIYIFTPLLASWFLAGWWWLTQKRISKATLLIGGLLFVVMMLLAILPHQISFPSTMETGYPLLVPDISVAELIPLYLMLVLSPILLLLFAHYLDGILGQQPNIRLLGVSFGLGGTFILLMIFTQVFTTVYDYIPVVGPFFRDKYWLAFLVPGLFAFLPILLRSNKDENLLEVPRTTRNSWIVTTGGMALVATLGVSMISAKPPPPMEEPNNLRVFTYNIQQGYDDLGERNFDGQVALVQSTNPDIVGLQESDTARIAGGNADVVAYFANRLDMYSYYGPSPITGTFGIALLSKYPIENPRTFYVYSKGEQVAVIEADITVGSTTYKVYVTHLGNSGPIFQIRQMLEIMRGQENVIAMGDFNFRPYEEQYSITTAEYDDAFILAQEKVAPINWGDDGVFDIEERIDHVFVSPGTPVLLAQYFTEDESDHPGLFVELGLGE